MSLISSPAQLGRIVRFRTKTARLSFDPNLGFHKVERVALSDVGQETVRDIANGNKYYFAFRPLNGHSGEESEEIGCLEEVSVATRCLTRDMARLLRCLLLTGWASLFGTHRRLPTARCLAN